MTYGLNASSCNPLKESKQERSQCCGSSISKIFLNIIKLVGQKMFYALLLVKSKIVFNIYK